MTAQVELNLFVGAAFEHAVEWYERTGAGMQGPAVDLTGLTFRFTLARQGQALFEASTDSGAIVSPDPARGVINLCFGAEALGALEQGDYEHALIPVRDGEAMTPLWVGRARVRMIGATAGPAMRIIGPAIAPVKVQRQGVGQMLVPARLRAGPSAPAGEPLLARIEALERAAASPPAAAIDLAPFAEELEQLRAQIAQAPMRLEAAHDPRPGDHAEALEALAARVGALADRPVVDPAAIDQAFVLLSQRLAALEHVEPKAAAPAPLLTTGVIVRPNKPVEIPDPFACVLLAALRTAGPCTAIWIGDAEEPGTWDVHVAPDATEKQIGDIQKMINVMAAGEMARFALIDNAGFVMAIADRRAQRSVWPEPGLMAEVEEVVPLPPAADLAIGWRARGGALYPPGELMQVKIGVNNSNGVRGGAAEGGDEPG